VERICVGALLLRGEPEPTILLGKRASDRAFYPDVWDVPGGHGEPGESPERTLVRELREEIGVTPMAWRSLGTFREPVEPDETPLVLHLFAVTAWSGEVSNRQPEEHAEIAWFSVADACRLPLAHPGYPALFRRLATAVG
jgi:mutator protein MutT